MPETFALYDRKEKNTMAYGNSSRGGRSASGRPQNSRGGRPGAARPGQGGKPGAKGASARGGRSGAPKRGAGKGVSVYTAAPTSPPLPDEVVITFDKGIPVAIDGRPVTPLEAIQEMNRRAGAQGIGRIDMVEDRLVGIKSREIYEAPGAVALIEAHQALESITLERMQHRYKRQLEQTWGELVYEAQWYSPLKKSMDAFIEHTQEYVSGDIRMILHGGRATVNGRRSESSLYDFNLATYETGDTFDQSSSRGFIDIYGLQSKLAAARAARLGVNMGY